VRNFYRKLGFLASNYAKSLIYASVCGLPLTDNLDDAFSEMETLLDRLNPYVEGFVWNPFSPNTAALSKLRTPEMFRKNAELVSQSIGGKLKLVKIGPYDDTEEAKRNMLLLIEDWMTGGGDGVVTTNTYMVPKDQVPSKDWGYPSAGRSGRSLDSYRSRSVLDIREAFPDAVIIATGGIFDGDTAYQTLRYADAVEGYTPYTFYGLGLLPRIADRVSERLQREGFKNLEEMQKAYRERFSTR